jgi:hypothetical protein
MNNKINIASSNYQLTTIIMQLMLWLLLTIYFYFFISYKNETIMG